MSDRRHHTLLRPESLTALGIVVVSAALLLPTWELRPISALLPGVMLIALIVLGAVMLIQDQRKARRADAAQPISEAPLRVLGAFLLIAGYAISTDLIGFYPSTIIIVPLVAYIFGYKSPIGLAIATLVVVGAIYLIFDFAMSQEFPGGRLWPN